MGIFCFLCAPRVRVEVDETRRRRTELELTQSELTDTADVSQPLIARIEGGDVDPRLSTLRRIVNALEKAESDVVHASDLMNEAVVSVAPDSAVKAAAQKMEEEAYSQLAVIQDGISIGSISQSDLVHLDSDARDEPIEEHMSESFPTVSKDATLDEISNLLEHYKAVMITEAGETVGIITEADIAARFS